MLTVYDHSESVCCHKIRIAIEEKGIECDHRIVKLEAGEQLQPDFLAINPKGVVPVFIDEEGRAVDESSIMLEYLEDRYPDPPLMPKDPYWRAVRRLWARRIDDGMHVPHISTISFVVAFSKVFRQHFDTQDKLNAYLEALPGEALRNAQRKVFDADLKSDTLKTSVLAYDKFIADMEKQLSQSKWLAGDAFSLADIDVIPYLWRLRNLQMTGMWANRPHVADWFARVTSRPSFKKAVIEGQETPWLDLMRTTGTEAWPVIKTMLAA